MISAMADAERLGEVLDGDRAGQLDRPGRTDRRLRLEQRGAGGAAGRACAAGAGRGGVGIYVVACVAPSNSSVPGAGSAPSARFTAAALRSSSRQAGSWQI